MSKRIPNPKEVLQRQAREIAENQGYQALTIRALVEASGLGIGTVYNYFRDKDAVIASFVLEDWQQALEEMEQKPAAMEQLKALYDCLHTFSKDHAWLFNDPEARLAYGSIQQGYHEQFRGSICTPLESVIPDPFEREFLAEALLTWALSDTDWKQLEPVFERITRKEP